MTATPPPAQDPHVADAGAAEVSDPSVDPAGSPNVLGPRLQVPSMGARPEHNRPAWFIAMIFLGQLGLFIALLAPVVVAMQLKINTFIPDAAGRAEALALVLPPGALAAVLFNALGGRLSDRTTSRWGRRRPWILGGMAVLVVAMLVIALGTNIATLAVGWFLAQAGGNLAFAAYLASLADQLPEQQYGKTSGLVGMAQNLGIMVATWLGAWLSTDMLLLFMVPALIGFVLMAGYALTIPDPVLRENRFPFDVRQFLGTFWTNPLRFPDFGLAWWGRFCIVLASYLFTTFRLQYMIEHLGIAESEAPARVAVGVTIYTIASTAAGLAAGWISDAVHRRKVIVAVSILVFGLGTYLLLHADSVGYFYVCEAIMGIAYGTYLAVDLALVFEVLPSREDAGKDLGVFNMANALPQSIAPAAGGMLLAGLGAGTNFAPLLMAAGAVGVLGAVLTMFIRGVR